MTIIAPQTSPSTQDKNEDARDRISELPAPIGESILSMLSLKEAAATSILSSQWRHIWTSSCTILDFLDETICCFLILHPELRDQKRRSYVDWVDQVVEKHTGHTIEQFKACFYLDHRFTSSIDKWIQFALKKRVQVLVLDFCTSVGEDPYTFPCKVLGGLEKGSHGGFESLRVLHLTNVVVTGEVLDCLLSNCQVLERLTVGATRNLVYIRVVGPLIPLKYLVIRSCFGLKSIEIRDTNLVSFSYKGNAIDVLLSNVPLLVEVSLREYPNSIGITNFFSLASTQLSCCLSQLETLRLDTYHSGLGCFNGIYAFPGPILLTSLKHLELVVEADYSFDYQDFQCYSKLSRLANLIKASPYLQRLVLKLRFCFAEDIEMKLEKAPKWTHHCLKVVEIEGYRGQTHIVEYVMDLIESAVALEKIVIDPMQPNDWCCNHHAAVDRRIERSMRERDHAMHQLKRMVPSTIEFVCL